MRSWPPGSRGSSPLRWCWYPPWSCSSRVAAAPAVSGGWWLRDSDITDVEWKVADSTLPGLDLPVTAGVPELAGRDPRFGAITLGNLLTCGSRP
jgi:hypothetical protein